MFCIPYGTIIWSFVTELYFNLFVLYIKEGHSQYQSNTTLSEIELIRFVTFSKQHTNPKPTHSQMPLLVDTTSRLWKLQGQKECPSSSISLKEISRYFWHQREQFSP